MTAEVAILNAEGAVLAADSAVTLETADGQKAFPKVSKIYALSSEHPIALMFHGSARFMDVPWETLAKEYRRTRGGASVATVADAARDFLNFLLASSDHFPSHAFDRGIRQCVATYTELFIERLVSKAGRSYLKANALQHACDELLEGSTLGPTDDESDDTQDRINALKASHQERISAQIKKILENIPLTETQQTKLAKHVIDIIAGNNWIPWPGQSGLVFAGFGEDQWFPAIVNWNVDLLHPGNRMKTKRSFAVNIGDTKRAIIAPFGDSDEIQAFVNGIHPQFSEHLISSSKSNQRNHIRDQISKTSDELFSKPIVDIVAGFPREELAAMAETLVSLCVFRKRLSGRVETVAGPIDVAVLSKGDGLVWVKRKHYFPSELNHQYFKRLK